VTKHIHPCKGRNKKPLKRLRISCVLKLFFSQQHTNQLEGPVQVQYRKEQPDYLNFSNGLLHGKQMWFLDRLTIAMAKTSSLIEAHYDHGVPHGLFRWTAIFEHSATFAINDVGGENDDNEFEDEEQKIFIDTVTFDQRNIVSGNLRLVADDNMSFPGIYF